MIVVGLTGGVASGKSHVLALFTALGAPAIEADDVGRAVVAPGEPALAEISSTFGAKILLADGSLDRRAMRERVFADPVALQRLEAITHPHIFQRLERWLSQQRGAYCLLSAAILLERGFDRLCQRVLVVDAPEHDQIARLMRRDGSSETLAKQMLARQWSRAERLARAHDVIDNPEPTRPLDAAVAALHRRYRALGTT